MHHALIYERSARKLSASFGVSWSHAFTRRLAALGVPVIDPDDAEALAALSPDLSLIPTEQYARYVARRVRPSDAPEASLRDLIAQHAVQDLRYSGDNH